MAMTASPLSQAAIRRRGTGLAGWGDRLPDAGQVEPGGDDDAHRARGRPSRAGHDPGRRGRWNDVRDVRQGGAGQGRQDHRGEAAAAQQPRGVTDERAHQPV
jgi:hypothetical protein